MPTELKIKWEGTAPGLAEGRLSLSAFGEPLKLLLASLRRIATNKVSDDIEESNVGRFAKEAKQLDIEITDLVKESSGFDSLITFTDPYSVESSLLASLQEKVGRELLEAIDDERQGVLRNSGVRRYLQSLPKGIAKQTYALHRNGTTLKEVSFTSTSISDVPPELPFIANYIGKVVGLGFEPGKLEVKIKTDRAVVHVSATAKQVESALNLRHSTVRAVVVSAETGQRLLFIQDVNDPVYKSTRDAAIYERWNELLVRLAQ